MSGPDLADSSTSRSARLKGTVLFRRSGGVSWGGGEGVGALTMVVSSSSSCREIVSASDCPLLRLSAEPLECLERRDGLGVGSSVSVSVSVTDRTEGEA